MDNFDEKDGKDKNENFKSYFEKIKINLSSAKIEVNESNKD